MTLGGTMDHDPYCRAYHPDLLTVELCTWCSVIKRVRADEQKKLDNQLVRAYNNGYRDGRKDAEQESLGYEKLAKDWKKDATNND